MFVRKKEIIFLYQNITKLAQKSGFKGEGGCLNKIPNATPYRVIPNFQGIDK